MEEKGIDTPVWLLRTVAVVCFLVSLAFCLLPITTWLGFDILKWKVQMVDKLATFVVVCALMLVGIRCFLTASSSKAQRKAAQPQN